MQSLCNRIEQRHAGIYELTIIYVPAEITKKNYTLMQWETLRGLSLKRFIHHHSFYSIEEYFKYNEDKDM